MCLWVWTAPLPWPLPALAVPWLHPLRSAWPVWLMSPMMSLTAQSPVRPVRPMTPMMYPMKSQTMSLTTTMSLMSLTMRRQEPTCP